MTRTDRWDRIIRTWELISMVQHQVVAAADNGDQRRVDLLAKRGLRLLRIERALVARDL